MDGQPRSTIPHNVQPAGHPGSSPELLQAGATCPDCGEAGLDYNGLLELECPACGIRSGGGAGST